MSMESSLNLALAICLVLPGVLLAVMPWLTPRGEVFAVTVPAAARRDPRIMRLRRGYVACMLATTVVITGLGVAGAYDVLVWSVLACLLPALGLAAMLVCRSRVQAIKVQEGWRAESAKASAAVLPPEAPRPLPLAWNLLYVPVILATVVLTVALYPAMPDQIPMHAGLDGQVNSWADKSVMSASLPVVVQLFFAGTLTGVHAGVLASKKGGSGSRRVASQIAYGKFAQMETFVLLGTGLALTASMGLIVLASAELISLSDAGVFISVITVAVLVIEIAVAVWCGQSGSRLLGEAAGVGVPDEMDADEDALWKVGVFYVNRDDPSIMVPKRFGIGWTLNFGNWRSWLITVAFLVVTMGFVVVCMAMAS